MPSQGTDRMADAERVAAFVLSHTVAAAGPRALQSRRSRAPLATGQGELPPSLATFAMRHVLKVPSDAERGLFGLAEGTHAASVLDHAPTPEELLAEQARGRRVVSLLPPGSHTGMHEDALAFAVHDLCHLDKFQMNHAGQVGFFETMRRADVLAFRMPDAGEPDRADVLDATWRADVVAVTCDMNGSPVFLLAALKMRLKMAVRRVLASAAGRPANTGGALTAKEEAAYEPILEELLDRCDLTGTAREAAREITARRQGMENAQLFVDEMERRGALSAPRYPSASCLSSPGA